MCIYISSLLIFVFLWLSLDLSTWSPFCSSILCLIALSVFISSLFTPLIMFYFLSFVHSHSFSFFFFCILGHLTSSTARTTLFSLRNLAKLLYLSAPVMLRCVSLIIWVLSSHSLSFPLISSLAYIYICSSHLIAFALYSAVRSCMSGEIRTTH